MPRAVGKPSQHPDVVIPLGSVEPPAPRPRSPASAALSSVAHGDPSSIPACRPSNRTTSRSTRSTRPSPSAASARCSGETGIGAGPPESWWRSMRCSAPLKDRLIPWCCARRRPGGRRGWWRHQVDGALFQHPGADGLLDVRAAAQVEHDRIDTPQMEQVGEHEAYRSGADDADLGEGDFFCHRRLHYPFVAGGWCSGQVRGRAFGWRCP